MYHLDEEEFPMSLGLKRGSWVRHAKHGVCYVGGTSRSRVSLHGMESGKRLTQGAAVKDCVFLTRSSWRLWGGLIAPIPLTAKAVSILGEKSHDLQGQGCLFHRELSIRRQEAYKGIHVGRRSL